MQLAAAIDGGVADFGELPDAIAGSDVVLTCVAGSEGLITADTLASWKGGTLLIVDIALPRNVDRAVAGLAGVTVLDLDDVRAWAERGAPLGSQRQTGCATSSPTNSSTSSSTRRRGRRRPSSPASTIAPSRSAAPRCSASHRVGELGAEHHEAVAALTKSIVAKLLHQPSVRLRHDAGTPQGERNAAAVSELFDLGPR